MPQCGSCLKAKEPCSYEPTQRKRGLKTGYVRVMECLWGLVFQSIEGSETAVELLISHMFRNGFWVGDEIRHVTKSGEAPLERWKSSKVLRVIDTLLSTSEDMMNEDDVTAELDLAETKDMDLNWTLIPQSQSHPLSIQTIQPTNLVPDLWYPTNTTMQEPVLRSSGSTAGPTQAAATAHTACNMFHNAPSELPQNAQRLLNRYFALTQSWLPILERHAIYRSLFAYRKALAVEGVKNRISDEDGVLWAIFAYSTTEKEAVGSGGIAVTTKSQDEFYTTARSTIPMERDNNYSISNVQTLLILGLLHYSACQWGIARLIIGQAILIAGHIGLDQPETCQTDRDRRTWLGCFVLDTLTSANTGKPPRVQSLQVRGLLPLDEVGNEEWEPWRLQEVLLPGVPAEMADIEAPTHTLTVFNTLLRLLCIVNDWMSSTAGGSINEYRMTLEALWDSLPEHIKTISTADTSLTVDMVSTTSPCIPANILNLSMIHVFLCTVLSCSVLPSSMEPSQSQSWHHVIQSVEVFLSRFDQHALPPSLNLIRPILTENVVHSCFLSELITILKRQVCGDEQADVGANETTMNNSDVSMISRCIACS